MGSVPEAETFRRTEELLFTRFEGFRVEGLGLRV